MKTIFLTSFNPFVTRNILLTDVFKTLSEKPDTRLVIFCPDYKLDYFTSNFLRPNVVIEPVKAETLDKQDVLFGYLARSLVGTSTLRIHRKEIFLRNKKAMTFLFSWMLALIGRIALVKKIVRWLDFQTISKSKYSPYFEKYKPSLVFAPDVFHVDDVHFLAEAKKKGIKTIGMIRSWDNITGKGLFRMKPDQLIVNNLVIKKEAMFYEDVAENKIFVGGMPQFDTYRNYPTISREEFFRRVGLAPDKKTILFAPAGNRFYDSDWRVMEAMKNAISKGVLTNAQVLVRLPPNDDVAFGQFTPDKNFSIDRPGKHFKENLFRDQELTREDMDHLANTLYYTDVIVSYSSTLCIDGAMFNKPIVTLAFDGGAAKPYLKSSRRFLDFTHVRKFLKTGCCKIAYSAEELTKHLNSYLHNPLADSEGRKILLADQVGFLDGKSGERIANFVLSCLRI